VRKAEILRDLPGKMPHRDHETGAYRKSLDYVSERRLLLERQKRLVHTLTPGAKPLAASCGEDADVHELGSF
jgi:hypothetical protein